MLPPKINTVSKNGLSLEYYVFGDGPIDVVCLHGHGRSVEDFEFIAAPERRVIAIHLFFHGNSYFPEDRIEKLPLQENEFIALFNDILEAESISKFHLFAFSQGGRFSLCALPYYSEQLLSLTLIAPDGMDNRSFYNWSSRQKWARILFRIWEKDPRRLYTYSKIAVKIGIMRPKVKSFVREFTSNKKVFRRASLSWRAFRELQPNPSKIGLSIQNQHLPFRIIMGSYDQVIRPKQAYAFEKKCALKSCVVEIESGHNFFKPTTINKFIHLLPFMEK